MTPPETTVLVPESVSTPSDSRLYGRGTECEALDRLIADVRAGRGRALTLGQYTRHSTARYVRQEAFL
jgi:hypothetical protein